MSSKESREWHLTANGWVAGTLQHDSGRNPISLPDNKVLTCIYKETIVPDAMALSGYGEPDFNLSSDVSVIWRCSDHQLTSELLDQFGSCPKRI
ncbi:MAG: hypothetical protein V7K98_03855 [Nostoc sp.]|uniref:hypothetical protein n=1 Tax=Nostoc sp. TaxID=1180 RepID=UPI002FFD4254